MLTSYRNVLLGLVITPLAATLSLNVTDGSSIKASAATIAEGLYIYHNAASTAGQFTQPQPWYWWLSGNGWEAIMNYIVYTGDTTHQADLLSSLSQNIGPNYDFVPPSQAGWEANDDQVYWVYNALTAMEYNFTALPCVADGVGGCLNSWERMSTNAFQLFVNRWNADLGTCGGGLKWQYNPNAAGYDYKNAVTNGGFFQTAARLARYTGNQTFADWATKIWDWSSAIGIVDDDFHVWDGTWDTITNGVSANCTVVSGDQWSYGIASYLHGAAHMYAFTTGDLQSTWETRVQGLVAQATSTFFGPDSSAPDIMYEQKCELAGTCQTDQTSFKGSLSRWLAKTTVLVPSVSDGIKTFLEATAEGVAAACSGYGNSTCGLRWYTDAFDGQSDFGVVLSSLETVQSLLVSNAPQLAVAP